MSTESPLIITFILGLGGTLMLTPLAEQLAICCGAMDKPDARKVHSRPTPRWGGIAIAISVLLAVALSFCIFESAQMLLDARMLRSMTGLIIGGLLIVIVGMLDDRYNMPAKVKLLCQIIIAVILAKFGIIVTFITLPGIGLIYLPVWLSWAITILWIVGMTNAINLLDGLDGLLAGVAVIFSIIFFVTSLLTGQYAVAIMMMAIAGACLGFLRYNFNPARIFMGDTGSLFLGLMFSAMSVMGAFKVTTTVSMIIPIVIMGLPIFDTSFAIFRRAMAGRPIFSPDKGHVHHQLLAKGLSVRQAVLLIYIICCTLGAAGLSVALLVH